MTIDHILASLPAQPEILRVERAARERDRIPLRSLPEMMAQLPRTVASAMDEISKLTRFFNPVELITIDDVDEVRRAFLATQKPPKLTYEKSTAALARALKARGLTIEAIERRLFELEEELSSDPPADPIGAFVCSSLLEKIADELATIALHRGLVARDDHAVKRALRAKYGCADEALHRIAELAYRHLEKTQAHAPEPKRGARSRRLSSEELAGAMRWMLERYYAHYEERTGTPFPEHARFRVVVDAKYSSVDVRDKSSEGPVIGIPPGERSLDRCLALLRHEIDQHARQSLNGQMMFGIGGGALKIDDETWYEGLAKLRDGTSPVLPYFTYAVRMADEGSGFVDVFDAIRSMRIAAGDGERSAASSAWLTTYRVFRGHSDATNRAAFGLAKDQAYLKGIILASQLEARGLLHFAEAAIRKRDGLDAIARFDFGPDDLLFPDLDLARRYAEQADIRAR